MLLSFVKINPSKKSIFFEGFTLYKHKTREKERKQ